MADRNYNALPKDDVINCFHWLIYGYFAEEMTNEDAEKAVSLMKDMLEEHYERITNLSNPEKIREMFRVLEERGVIAANETEQLHWLLKCIPCDGMLQKLREYEDERPVVLPQQQETVKDTFIGREEEVRQLKDVIETAEYQTADTGPVMCRRVTRVTGVLIEGFAGIGKTSLAKQVVSRLNNRHRLYLVNLRGLAAIESIYFAVMYVLNVPANDYQPHRLFEALKALDEDSVLLLDNADDVLELHCKNTFREPFLQLLKQILTLKNKHLKVIITSRFQLSKEELGVEQDSPDKEESGVEKYSLVHKKFGMTQFSVAKMTEKDALDLIKTYAAPRKISGEDLKALAMHCGYHPLAMKLVAARLKYPHIPVRTVISELSKNTMATLNLLELKGLDSGSRVENCMESAFTKLTDFQKEALVKLSIVPGTFSLKAASCIITNAEGGRELEGLRTAFILQDLANRNMLEWTKGDDQGTRYQLHLLLRSFLQEKAKTHTFASAFNDARVHFVEYYNKVLRKLGKLLEINHNKAVKEKDRELPNLLWLIDNEHMQLSNTNETLVTQLVDLLKNDHDRWKLYQDYSFKVQHSNPLLFVTYKCYEIAQMMSLRQPFVTIQSELKKVSETLSKLPNRKCKDVQLGCALYMHYEGILLARGIYNSSEKEFVRGIGLLKKAEKIRKQILGPHTLTARSLFELGSSHVYAAKWWSTQAREHMMKAKGYYEECLQMRRMLNYNHMDTPAYIAALARCYDFERGAHEKTLSKYREALELEEQLGLQDTDTQCSICYSMAGSHFKAKNYPKALELSQKSLQINKKLSKGQVNQREAECLCIIGLATFNLEKISESKRYLEDAFQIECKLREQGRPHSEQWNVLKQVLPQIYNLMGMTTERTTFEARCRDAETHYHRAVQRLERGDNSGISDDELTEDEDDDNHRSPKATQEVSFEDYDDVSISSGEGLEELHYTGNVMSRGLRNIRFMDITCGSCAIQ